MAIRVRKSFKIAPGIKINVSKSGLSTSLGGKRTTVNLSKCGSRVTTVIPGTGISSSTLYKSKGKPSAPSLPREYSKAEWMTAWIIGEILAVVGWVKLEGGVRALYAANAVLIPPGVFLYYRSKRNQ